MVATVAYDPSEASYLELVRMYHILIGGELYTNKLVPPGRNIYYCIY
jgi:hypothetical protein